MEEEESQNEQEEEQMMHQQSQSGSSECRGTGRKTIECDHVGELGQILIESFSQRRAADDDCDDDKHFLLSLLNSARSVPNHLKLAMRTEIMQVVAKYCSTSANVPQQSYPI